MTGQHDFAAALMAPGGPVPEGLIAPGGAPAGKRFDIYRNNVAVSLTEALETGFPVIRKLVGAEFFTAMAGVHLRASPPRSPVMMFYGEEFPAFLESFPPVAHLPYLADVARLELALRRAYHAADAAPLDPAQLAAVPPERLRSLRFALAPAVAVLTSAYPIHAIWRANTDPAAPPPGAGPEAVLVARPGFDPIADPLSASQTCFVATLQRGAPLGEAMDVATAADPAFALSETLALLLRRGALQSFTESDAP